MIDTFDVDALRKPLLRRYLVLLAPAAAAFAAWAVVRQAGMAPTMDAAYVRIVGPASFIAAVILALGLPMLYRIQFVKSVRGSRGVGIDLFLSFQQGLMTLALLAPYAAALGYVAGVSNFHFCGAFLASLYGAYYYYPSAKRVAQEMRVFRVIPGSEDEPA